MSRRLLRGALAAALLAALAWGAAGCRAPYATGPLAREGRWLTDASGRVVLLHGFNEVAKAPPFDPAAAGFGEDDAAFLQAHGFNAVRLGVVPEGLLPRPGAIDTAYIDRIAATVEVLARHHIFVLLDFHQDGYAPMFNGNGFPDWMAVTDGLPNPRDAVFPLYYVQNPAMQRAFEHFWRNSPGPDGVGLQDAFFRGFAAVVDRFAGDPWVLGYEPMNEPWPGADWMRCAGAAGCPDLEAARLQPFYDRAAAIVRARDPRQLLFGEPFVLFNFGGAPTALALSGPQDALSFHSYALDWAGERGVVRQALDAATARRAPLVATEFGATLDGATLDRLAGELDAALVPWMEWAYNGLIVDAARPAGLGNLRSLPAFLALVRPYAVLVNGTPAANAFDPASGVFEFRYGTRRPDGKPAPLALDTVIAAPALRYLHGYTVSVQGARVVSPPCAKELLLRTEAGAASVTVRIAPGGGCPAAAP